MEYNEIIAELIGQSRIEHEILYALHQERFFVFEVIGERGAGKKTLSNHVVELWNEQSNGTVYYLDASYQKIPEDYSTFKNLKIQNRSTKTAVLNIFCESLKDVPYIGNSLSSMASEIIKGTIDGNNQHNFLTQDENYIFSRLHKHAHDTPILFICNDFELWDLKSQQALSALMEYEKKNIDYKAFFILNTVSSINGLDGSNVKKRFLNKVPIECISEVVHQINVDISLNSKQLESLTELTAGNLELIKESISLFDKDKLCPGKSFYNIIEDRLNNTTNNATNVLKLLRQTAFVGERVDSRLLKLYFSIEPLMYEDLLDESIRLSYLEEKEYTISFIQQYVYNVLKDRNYKDRKYYKHLSKCINILYPSRYDLQMQYLYRGGLNHEADKMFFLYLIGYYRENNIEYQLSSFDKKRLSQNSLYSFYVQMCNAYKFYKQKKYDEAEKIIFSLYCSDIAFRFEKDYLYSLIVTNKYYTNEEFGERINALIVYTTDEFKEEYPEMYLRVQMMLAEFYAEIDSMNDVKKSLQEIVKCFSGYSATDKKMQCYEYCFKMKSNAFYKVEIATKYTRDAYVFFEKAENKQYYIGKYYLAILNHSANEIVMGNFEKAYEMLCNAYAITKEYIYLESIHEDILINNLAISGYYCGRYSASECVESLERIAMNLSEPADNLLLKNNQVAFWSFEGSFDKALSISKSLYEKILFLDDIDPYYHYFIANNYCILLWIKGKRKNAKNILSIISNLQPLPQDNAYFKARAVFLKELIEKGQPDSIINNSDWNNYVVNQNQNIIGRAWKFWGSLLLFSEFQIWSDY